MTGAAAGETVTTEKADGMIGDIPPSEHAENNHQAVARMRRFAHSKPSHGTKKRPRTVEVASVFNMVGEEDVELMNVIRRLQKGAGRTGPLIGNGYFLRLPHLLFLSCSGVGSLSI